jgi:hypothetical protein
VIENVTFRPAYLAAPFAPWGSLSALDNTIRARTLARYAITKEGIAPVYVHEAVWLGAFGDESKPEERERGLRASLAIAEAVALAGGELWLLELPDGSFSSGCERERATFERAARGVGIGYTIRQFKALSCYPGGVICSGVEHFAPPYDHALGDPEPTASSACPPGAGFVVKIVSVKFEIHDAYGNVAKHEGPLEHMKEITVARAKALE